MKKNYQKIILLAGLVPAMLAAQEVDRSKYPDYSSLLTPNYSLLEKSVVNRSANGAVDAPLPDHVNNAELKFFPPVFNQAGGSCGSASRICYMFTHEINAFRNLDGSNPANYYPSHFVWLLTYGNSGKDAFVQHVGVPSAELYGGQTYSAQFGNQDCGNKDFGWMQGYDKWFAAMHNRMLRPTSFPKSLGTEEGREAVKRWLYNHNGDTDFHGGGIVGLGVASGGDWQPIPSTPTNNAIGVAGMKYVKRWGTQVDHALTLVGYDDRIEFDLNGNGVFGEKNADEVGAWIIVNSWGSGWCNGGFIYCPYAYAGSHFVQNGDNYSFSGSWWYPEIYQVRKNYRPLRTIKLKMDYSRRSELCLSAGISSNLNDTVPQQTQLFDHFIYAGDGNYGNSNPAPEVPMLGRWADGKLHTEPMEFGYDLTDLSANFDKNMPLKYFFVIETKSWAQGHGKIYDASIIDYEYNLGGVETPFEINGEGVEIRNAGNKTIISVIVYGETFYAPQNPSISNNTFTWQSPMKSGHKLQGYKLYSNGNVLETLSPDVLSYTIPEEADAVTYGVTAVYENNKESSMVSANLPVVSPTVNMITNFKHSGFSIPNVFSAKMDQATIEFWICPNSLTNWNQSAGPGWGTYLMHANGNGAFTAGWDTGEHRADTPAGKLKNGIWAHVAVTIDGNVVKIYINGVLSASATSSKFKGIGGFGDFIFRESGDNNNTDARMDEIRIWNYAKSADDIVKNKNVQYSGSIMPEGLLAYYKGDVVEIGGKKMLRDCVGNNHAEILNDKWMVMGNSQLRLTAPTDELFAEIIAPTEKIYAGTPVAFDVKRSNSVTNLVWTSEGAGIEKMESGRPSFIFQEAGKHSVIVEATNAKNECIKDTCIVDVEEGVAPDATFTPTKQNVSAGEQVSFIVKQPVVGYVYEWQMPGADVEKAMTVNAAASYAAKGEYVVTLKVTAPNGKEATYSQRISVVEVAPVADFSVAPAVVTKGETTFLKDKSKYTPNQWQWQLHSSHGDVIINGQNSSYTPIAPGVYDVKLAVANSTGRHELVRERALIVCNADSKNGLSFNSNAAYLKLSKNPFITGQSTFTIEWWMNPTSLTTNCAAIGQDENTFLLYTDGNGAMKFYINKRDAQSSNNYVIAGQWHHYAVAFTGRIVKFYRDGQLISSKAVGTSKMPEISDFVIGNINMPMTGQIDEFRIWNSELSEEEIQAYANSPIEDVAIAESEHNLAVYYNFNQNGGDVMDVTSNGNTGIRHNFGPDGDAWGLSKGVFSLNFDKSTEMQDVTSQYLKNYKSRFLYDSEKIVNPSIAARFYEIKDWILENASVNGDVTTSVHVDKSKDCSFTFTSGWDYFEEMVNHKAYQVMTLPAGAYTFTATYGEYEGECGESYLVVSKERGLPDTENIEDDAIAYVKMKPKSATNANVLSFVLEEETTVSLGLLINMTGNQCCTIKEFNLVRNGVEIIEADGANGYDLTVGEEGYTSLYLPYPVAVPEGVTAYWAKEIRGNEVIVEPIEDKIIPARTGVIIAAKSGDYHFDPSPTPGSVTSVLGGVLTDTEMDNSKRYYTFDVQQVPGFYLNSTGNLPANTAFVMSDNSDMNEFYQLNIVPVGIEDITSTKEEKEIYDLSGRRVVNPTKGLYISNGKKVLIK